MEDGTNDRIIELCDAAIEERDPDKRFKIVWEISVIIDKIARERAVRGKNAEH